ncbi:MAG: hypothetical protein Ct9H300mP12_14990 [Acidimicrobiales bacterium]|nr:MAG: hypothetical protein Ct9H300mP12_14990 [Acidimicrobiales bacterium]
MNKNSVIPNRRSMQVSDHPDYRRKPWKPAGPPYPDRAADLSPEQKRAAQPPPIRTYPSDLTRWPGTAPRRRVLNRRSPASTGTKSGPAPTAARPVTPPCSTATTSSTPAAAGRASRHHPRPPHGEDVVDARTDSSHGMVRVETTCSACGAHLGQCSPTDPSPPGPVLHQLGLHHSRGTLTPISHPRPYRQWRTRGPDLVDGAPGRV